MRLRDLCDYIYPTLEKKEQISSNNIEEINGRIDKLPSIINQLNGYIESIEKLIEEEESRRNSVNTRLISIVGLTSIVATLVFTTLLAMAAGSMPLLQGGLKQILLVIACFYLVLQLYAALNAAIKGLSRASYDSETIDDLLPPDKLSSPNFLRQRISKKNNLLNQHRSVNNEKVSQMAVAHIAIKNFLFALLIMAGIISWMALSRELPKREVICSEMLTELCATNANPSASTPLVSGHGKQRPISEKDQLSMSQEVSRNKTVLTKIVTLGPFSSGEHKLNLESALSCMREALVPYHNLAIIGWQIIGRADKHQLRADLAAIYGSNQSLAMARATWVVDNVLPSFPSFDPETAVISVGGARNVGTKVKDSKLQLDRVVDIYVMLNQEISMMLPAPPTASNVLCHISTT